MKVEFTTGGGAKAYAPPEESKRSEEDGEFVWVRLDSGEITRAFMR
ncbi:hypothetical protein [Halorubrum tailed virus BLv36]|nr:hypothetical protein [Halorubrum tailed virus BLv36]